MKVSLRWLRDYVDVDVSPSDLAEKLDLSGTKVEALHSPGGDVRGVVAGRVLAIEEHPNADNLLLVEVDVDEGTPERVVCGAHNFGVGDRVAYARVGSRLPGMEITERKIRGQTSRGMLCSAAELGVSKDHSGILVLPGDIELGRDVVDALGLDDTVLELELTPNRPDCMGMIGVAREVAALLGHELKIPDAAVSAPSDLRSPVQVHLEDPEGCPRYVARYAEVQVGDTPLWMAARLLAAGVRTISNVVDVTNYVMLETGQPLHAFDADRVARSRVVVRRAREGERLVTLDGEKRDLHVEDLLIADAERALALAGVMGGGDSEVSEATTAIILESAYFDAATVARTSRRHGLRTEASARFERGADPEIPAYAAQRALSLLEEVASARVAADGVDAYPVRVRRRHITLRPTRTTRVLGYGLDAGEQARLLRSIGLPVEDDDGRLEVEVPGFRPDLAAEVDLIEEVARLAGLHRLDSTLPPGRAGLLDPQQRAERALRVTLASYGLHEAWTPSFTSPRDLEALGLAAEHPAVAGLVYLDNPMSEDEPVLRTTLLPGLLAAAARNVSRGVSDGALFEMARVYEAQRDAGAGPLPAERRTLAAVAWGERVRKSWATPGVPWDFFAAKGVVEAAVGSLGLPALEYAPASGMPFHPTRVAAVSLAGEQIGVLGELHPGVCEHLDLRPRTVAWEIALAPLLTRLPGRTQATEPGRFPPILRDLAVVVPEDVAAGRVARSIEEAGAPEVVSVRLFDVYRGDQVPQGAKSLAFALELRAADRTLTDDEAAHIHDRILVALRQETGATLRA